MTKRRFTDEVEQEICRRYEAGESSHQLAKSLEASQAIIWNALKRGKASVRPIKQAQGGLSDSEEQEVCKRYLLGETQTQLGNCFQKSPRTISSVLRRHGINGRTRRCLTSEQEQEAAFRYKDGESIYELATAFGVSSCGLRGALIRQGIGRRSQKGGECVEQAIDCSQRHARPRECSFYLFELANHANTHCKPGIAFAVDRRADEEYGTETLRLIYGTRQEAYFLEQAVLDATRGSAQCPADLAGWDGASEVRAMPAEDMLPIVERLAEELEELGVWAFAAAYVPMTAAQRATCQQRALANAPVLSSASTAE